MRKAQPEEVMETPFLKMKTKNKPIPEHLGAETLNLKERDTILGNMKFLRHLSDIGAIKLAQQVEDEPFLTFRSQVRRCEVSGGQDETPRSLAR